MLSWKRRFLAVTLFAALPLAAEVRSLTILHTNDIHAQMAPRDDGQGGLAGLATVVRHERAGCTDCILLDAGDMVQGTPVSTIFHGLPVYQALNLLHFSAGALGNHDFDYGWSQTLKFIGVANHPVLCSNVSDAGGHLLAKPYAILKVNKLRVAVIGVLTDGMTTLETPKQMGEWRETSMVAAVRKYAAEVKDKSDIVVLLAHVGPQEEDSLLSSEPEVPVIVTGHLHDGLAHEKSHDGRVLVRVKSEARELGRLELKVDTEKKAPVSWTWKKIEVDSKKVQPDAQMAAVVKHWEGEVSSQVDQPLAVAQKAFTQRELKPVIEQAMRDATGADFAYMNSGGIRAPLPKGQLLVRHIWDVMPFDNMVVVGKFKGSQLPARVLGGKTVEPDRDYTLAVTDFTAANQSAGSELGTKDLQFPEEKGLLRDMLVDWFRKKKTIE